MKTFQFNIIYSNATTENTLVLEWSTRIHIFISEIIGEVKTVSTDVHHISQMP